MEHLFGHAESYHTLYYSQMIDNEEDSAAIPMLYRHLIAARLDICRTSRKRQVINMKRILFDSRRHLSIDGIEMVLEQWLGSFGMFSQSKLAACIKKELFSLRQYSLVQVGLTHSSAMLSDAVAVRVDKKPAEFPGASAPPLSQVVTAQALSGMNEQIKKPSSSSTHYPQDRTQDDMSRDLGAKKEINNDKSSEFLGTGSMYGMMVSSGGHRSSMLQQDVKRSTYETGNTIDDKQRQKLNRGLAEKTVMAFETEQPVSTLKSSEKTTSKAYNGSGFRY